MNNFIAQRTQCRKKALQVTIKVENLYFSVTLFQM